MTAPPLRQERRGNALGIAHVQMPPPKHLKQDPDDNRRKQQLPAHSPDARPGREQPDGDARDQRKGAAQCSPPPPRRRTGPEPSPEALEHVVRHKLGIAPRAQSIAESLHANPAPAQVRRMCWIEKHRSRIPSQGLRLRMSPSIP